MLTLQSWESIPNQMRLQSPKIENFQQVFCKTDGISAFELKVSKVSSVYPMWCIKLLYTRLDIETFHICDIYTGW